MEDGPSKIDASVVPSKEKKNKSIVKRFSKKLVKVFASKKKKAQKPADEEVKTETNTTLPAIGEALTFAETTVEESIIQHPPTPRRQEERRVDDQLEECAFWARDTADMRPKSALLGEQEETSPRRKEILDTMFAGKSSDDTAEQFDASRFLLEKLHSVNANDLSLFLRFLELSEEALDEQTLNQLVEVVDALCILDAQIKDRIDEEAWPVSKGLEGKIDWVKYNVNLSFREQLDARTAAAIAAERVGSKPTTDADDGAMKRVDE